MGLESVAPKLTSSTLTLTGSKRLPPNWLIPRIEICAPSHAPKVV
jgi:hypothetical protein